jgi:hypothetical protein
MKSFRFLFVLCVFWCDGKAESNLQNLSSAMSSFGDGPSKEAFEGIENLVETSSAELDKMTNAAPLLAAVFEYRAAQKYKWKIKGDSVVARVAKELLSGKSKLTAYINDDTQIDPTKLDVWWSSYSATREDVYLKKVLFYAGEEAPKSDLKKALIVGSATWSFSSNCKQHRSVREFAQRCLADPLYSSKKSFLQKCVDE